MSPNKIHTLARLHFPDPNRLVEGTRSDQIGLRIEVDAEDETGVAAEGFEAIEGGACVPDTEGAVVGGGADVVGIGGPGEVGDALGVADEAFDGSEGGGGPEDEGFVEGGGGEESAVVGEFDAGDGAAVAGEGFLKAVRFVRRLLGCSTRRHGRV